MANVFTMPRNELEQIVRTFGYSWQEIETFTLGELQDCICANTDIPEPDWYNADPLAI
jgi:hypothetical protein